MEIKKLDPAQWRGYGFTARYQTGGCWDIVPVEEGFRIEYHSFGKVEERSFNDTLFGEWLEEPVWRILAVSLCCQRSGAVR